MNISSMIRDYLDKYDFVFEGKDKTFEFIEKTPFGDFNLLFDLNARRDDFILWLDFFEFPAGYSMEERVMDFVELAGMIEKTVRFWNVGTYILLETTCDVIPLTTDEIDNTVNRIVNVAEDFYPYFIKVYRDKVIPEIALNELKRELLSRE